MFLKNCWYVAGWDHELIDGKLLNRTLLNEHVLIYRGESGKVVAMSDRCPHRGALLSQGRLEGDAVRCMYHGIKFDGSGKCVQIPGQDMIPPKMRVRTYPIHESGHLVWIWMGDPAKADVSTIGACDSHTPIVDIHCENKDLETTPKDERPPGCPDGPTRPEDQSETQPIATMSLITFLEPLCWAKT